MHSIKLKINFSHYIVFQTYSYLSHSKRNALLPDACCLMMTLSSFQPLPIPFPSCPTLIEVTSPRSTAGTVKMSIYYEEENKIKYRYGGIDLGLTYYNVFLYKDARKCSPLIWEIFENIYYQVHSIFKILILLTSMSVRLKFSFSILTAIKPYFSVLFFLYVIDKQTRMRTEICVFIHEETLNLIKAANIPLPFRIFVPRSATRSIFSPLYRLVCR